MKTYRRLLHLHRTLAVAAIVVPAGRRQAWRQEWVAELSFVLAHSPGDASRLATGLVADALAMRWVAVVNSWRAVDWRSPELCLHILFGIFALLLTGSVLRPALRHLIFSRWGLFTSALFLTLAVFTVPSTVVVSRFGACDAYQGDAATHRRRLVRWAFLGSKLTLVVLSSYLLAVVLMQPLYRSLGFFTNFLLLVCGMVFNVVAIGWVFSDQRERCPTCMRLLHSPARMGPPSWSLLASNATEEMCDRGHGLLHRPQWQTSWFNNARWLQLDRTWRGLFRP